MKIFYLLLALIPHLAFSNSQITTIIRDANEKFEAGINFDKELDDDMNERIDYEIERWKAPKSEQRFFWREVIMQTHYHAYYKSYALQKWYEASEASSYSIKDFEDIMVQAHYEYLQVQKEISQSKIENEYKLSEFENWSHIIDKLRNIISNYPTSSERDAEKKKKQVEELDKIFKIRIDKSLHFKVLQNE